MKDFSSGQPRFAAISWTLSLAALVACVMVSPVRIFAGQAAKQPATFARDIAPILQRSCQTCHRPSGIAPMSLLTYESARPWAKAIKAAVISKQMPPWFAARCGRNDAAS